MVSISTRLVAVFCVMAAAHARDLSGLRTASPAMPMPPLPHPPPPPIVPAEVPPHPQAELREQIRARFDALLRGDLDASVEPELLADKVCEGVPAGELSADQIAELMAETAAYQSSYHPDFGKLAARVAVARLHERTDPSLLHAMRAMHAHTHNGEAAPLVSADMLERAEAHAEQLEAALRHDLDYNYDYFGLRTLQRSYLHRDASGAPIERPQHMLMRVALCVHATDLSAVLQAYDLMSRGLYTHATPTLFNAGSPRQQLCSCFLLTTQSDSISGIFDTLRQVCHLSTPIYRPSMASDPCL